MVYLAMTAAEFRSVEKLPERCAWMACHFSPYGTGLTNLPSDLPEGSLLILNDRTPVHGHDPMRIRETLEQLIDQYKCSGLLLDFQRPECKESQLIIQELLRLPCPVCVAVPYGDDLDCPIFLPPVPLHLTPEEYLKPWSNREIWLDAALDSQIWMITESGSILTPPESKEIPECPHFDDELLCHYRIDTAPERATLTLQRTYDDLNKLLDEAQKYGVTRAVGLWQEFAR